MRRRELLAAAGAAASVSLAGCIGDSSVEVVEGAEHVNVEDAMTGPSAAELTLALDDGVRTRADYIVVVHGGVQRDVRELASGETSAEVTVYEGRSLVLFLRGGETFKRDYEQRHRGGTTVARSVIEVRGLGVV